VVRVETEGDTPTERVLRTVMLGDLLSLSVASARGSDPDGVAVLEGFKQEMGRP
jgi:hypothetical protein